MIYRDSFTLYKELLLEMTALQSWENPICLIVKLSLFDTLCSKVFAEIQFLDQPQGETYLLEFYSKIRVFD